MRALPWTAAAPQRRRRGRGREHFWRGRRPQEVEEAEELTRESPRTPPAGALRAPVCKMYTAVNVYSITVQEITPVERS